MPISVWITMEKRILELRHEHYGPCTTIINICNNLATHMHNPCMAV